MAKDYPWNDGHRTEYYAAVGYLSQQWNVLEWLYCHRASEIMGLKRSQHDLIFRHLGIVSIGLFMDEYAESHIKSAAIREQVAYVTKFVHACRVNRNAIIHGRAREDSDLTAIKLLSKADQRRPKTTEFSISIDDIERVCSDIEMAGRLTVALSFLFLKKGRVKLAKELLGSDWRSRLHAKAPPPQPVRVGPPKPQKQQHRAKSSSA